jgi:hypothetical protein
MTFHADIRHWPSVEAFEQHLAAHDPAVAMWVTELVYHHTYRPLRHQWYGRKTMDSLVRYYRDDQGWSSGPHLFVAPDGIWQLTPLHLPGTHAMAGNDNSWGIEVVGDYDHEVWPRPIANLALGAGAALLRWRGLPATRQTVSPHSAYNPKKTCPGRKIDLEWVRAELSKRLAPPTTVGYSEHSRLLGTPKATMAQAIRYILDRLAGKRTDYTTLDIVEVIVPRYWELCVEVGLDPVLLIAQMIHETACLTAALAQRRDKDGKHLRNPAGIGVNGQVSSGPAKGYVWDADHKLYRACVGFKDWATEAIPAHVGRALAYALAPQQRSQRQQALVTQALGFRSLDLIAHGSAPTLKPLGAIHNPANIGRPEELWVGWAKRGEEYGENIAEIAERIRTYPV